MNQSVTLTTANHIAALDISDLNNVKRLDDPNENQPTVGPHYIKVTPLRRRNHSNKDDFLDSKPATICTCK